MTNCLIAVISLANADAAVRLVVSIINVSAFTNDAKILLASGGAIWLTNVIAFGLWYWALDRGGPAARASGAARPPALVFPEMKIRGVRLGRLDPEVRGLLPFFVCDVDGIQPHRCFGDPTVDEADDDGAGGNFPGRRITRL